MVTITWKLEANLTEPRPAARKPCAGIASSTPSARRSSSSRENPRRLAESRSPRVRDDGDDRAALTRVGRLVVVRSRVLFFVERVSRVQDSVVFSSSVSPASLIPFHARSTALGRRSRRSLNFRRDEGRATDALRKKVRGFDRAQDARRLFLAAPDGPRRSSEEECATLDVQETLSRGGRHLAIARIQTVAIFTQTGAVLLR